MKTNHLRHYPEYCAANAIVSVYDLLRVQAVAFADRPLLILPQAVAAQWALQERSLSYAQVLSRVDKLAACYRAQGYGRGHRVALLLENRPTHFVHWLALNSLGVSVVPVNPDYSDNELLYLLTHSESQLIVTLASWRARIDSLAGTAGVAVSIDGEDTLPPAQSDCDGSGRISTETECALLYTSGTTGRPKGCQLSNTYFHGWAIWYGAQLGLIALTAGQERLITPLPTFHINAMGNSFMGMLASGGAQIIVDRFHPSSWMDMAIETHATCFHYLGVMPAILLQLPPRESDTAHQMRFGMGGGVHPDHHATFEQRFGVPLLEGWAMTETGGAGILCATGEPRHVGSRCVGQPQRPGPPLQVCLVDDHGQPAQAGTPGELLVRADGDDPRRGFFSGYLKDPVATEAIWDDGWMHTGDIMAQATDGTLRFVDRKKNIVRRSGENISATEVEAVIQTHSTVQSVAVVATPDKLREEEVLAAIVTVPGVQPDPGIARDIFEHCRERLAYFKLPGYIAFCDKLPTTSTQKVRKADLGDLAANPAGHANTTDLRAAKQSLRPGAADRLPGGRH